MPFRRVRCRLGAVRVATGVNLLEGTDADMGVNLGGVEPGMAEHLLNVADVGSSIEHVGGTGMPQEMAGTGQGNANAVELLAYPVADELGAETVAVAA